MIEMKAQLAGNAALAQIEAVQKEWKKALLEEGKEIQKLYKYTTATWKDHHPRFDAKYGEGSGRVWVVVSTENDVYYWVHEGVSKLRAVFSKNWHPKTQPGRLTSRGGRGQLIYVGMNVDLPSYTPRKFTDVIVKARQQPFQKRMQHATAVGARAASRGG